MTPAERLNLLEFPCDFPVKAFGQGDEGFDLTVVTIIRRHAPDLGEGAVTVRPSRGGRYQAVTVIVRATGQAQLDAIYADLSACESVLMAL
jgi:putative lipoic acid-binding regulatory protein